MTDPNEKDVVKKKLEEIRSTLMGNPTDEELNKMQLHMNTIEKWARVDQMMRADHHDDDNGHHHHEATS